MLAYDDGYTYSERLQAQLANAGSPAREMVSLGVFANTNRGTAVSTDDEKRLVMDKQVSL